MHVYVPYDLRDDIENKLSDERWNRNFPVIGNGQRSYRARNMYVHSTYMNICTYMCMYVHYYSMHRYEHNVYAYAYVHHTQSTYIQFCLAPYIWDGVKYGAKYDSLPFK